MLSIQNAIEGIKSTVEKIINPDASRLALLNREQIEALIDRFPEEEIILREDIRRRFEKALGRNIPENRDWFEIENLFEFYFSNRNGHLYNSGDAYQYAAKELNYSIELLKRVMKCVGKGEALEMQRSGIKPS